MRNALFCICVFSFVISPLALAATPDGVPKMVSLQASKGDDAPQQALSVNVGDLVKFLATTQFEESKLYILASAAKTDGELDWANYVVLAMEGFSGGPGELAASYEVPAGFGGQDMVAQAFAITNDGKAEASETIQLHIVQEKPVTLSVASAGEQANVSELTFTAGDVLLLEASTNFAESKLYILASPPLTDAGGLDWSRYIVIMAERMPEPGTANKSWTVPDGVQGELVIQAFAISNGDGQVAASEEMLLRFK